MSTDIQIGGTVNQPLRDQELRREELFRQIENLGDFRRGSICVTYRNCCWRSCSTAMAEVTAAPHLDCSQGHAAEFVGYRDKEILTVVSSVEARRAYYHCQECQSGFAPKDKELDVVGSSFSPGVRRMMARVGAKEPFEQGRGDLEALAGVVVRTKQVERISVQLGQQVEAFCQREREAIL